MIPRRAGLPIGMALVLAGLLALQPPAAAVSDFTYYTDAASPGTTDCLPTSSGCTGQCAVPTCGSQATPCHTIQQSINLANCNIGSNTALEADVIVAAGTYPERLFIYPNIHVIGAGRDVTTIDAKGFNRSAVIMSKQTLYGFARPGTKFSITGFRITHGSGDLITLTDTGGNLYYERGGGGLLLYGDGSAGWPRVTDCRIEDNTLADPTGTAPDWMGAGIYIAVGAPLISGNIIQRNTSTPPDLSGQDEALGWGAGIFSLNFDCRPVITHNVIRNNVTVAQQGNGAGMYVNGEQGTILSNNLVTANSASVEGGGIYIYGNNLSAYDNVVVGNTAGVAGGGFDLGAQTAPVNVTNNTVAGNVLTVTASKAPFSTGGGINAEFVVPQTPALLHLTNNLVARNDATATGLGGGLYSYNTNATNDHQDYYSDRPNEIRGDYTDATVIGTDGNVSLDPVFASAPAFWDHTNAAGTSGTAVVYDSTRYAVGDHIEYNDDGISRQVTAINGSTKTLTFTPALAYTVCSNAVNASCATNADCRGGCSVSNIACASASDCPSPETCTRPAPGTCVTATTLAGRILSNWGSSTSVTEDLRLTVSSLVIDEGTNTPLYGTVPSTDFDDLPRPVDGDQNGSSIIDIGAFEFRFPDTDGDGVPDNLDCAPLVNSVWTAPEQVPSPLAVSGSQILSWPGVPQSNVYNVYYGTVANPFDTTTACFAAEVPGHSISIDGGPTPGLDTAFYYLVGGVNRCGNGAIYESPLLYPSLACPPQNVDTDGDFVPDIDDDCPTVYNPLQEDPDHDTVGLACDNCPNVYNPAQADPDGDLLGSACDNCPDVYNPLQTDTNLNGIGDDCEDMDGDTYPLTVDCDDTNPAVHPGAVEVCNGIDDNCVNGIDEGGDALCDDANVCTQDTCAGASGCQHAAVTDGSPCDDGTACTQTDTCQAGVCTGSDPVICTAPDQCHSPGTCNPTTGVCSAPPAKPNYTLCDDGNACTQTDWCQAGVCTGVNPVVCVPLGQCYDPGTCDPATGTCSASTVKADGSTCTDGNDCTVGDNCQSGVCQSGSPRDMDADTHVDALCGGDDCNDSNPLVWHAPAEVTHLTLTTQNPADPTWDSQAADAGPETTYDLVTGPLTVDPGMNYPSSTCLLSADPATSYSDSRLDPLPDNGFWYLARARNSCGVSSFGSTLRDTTIPNCP